MHQFQNKVVIFVFCLFVYLIITLEPLDCFSKSWNGELGRTTGMVFAWLKNSKLIQLTLTEAKFKEFESWLKIET